MKACLTCGAPNINTLTTPHSESIHDDCSECAIKKYIAWRQTNGFSQEELCEMRAAFGPGATVVDVFTGQTMTV